MAVGYCLTKAQILNELRLNQPGVLQRFTCNDDNVTLRYPNSYRVTSVDCFVVSEVYVYGAMHMHNCIASLLVDHVLYEGARTR